ncbi:hypothetical protein J4225_01495 [Candidatus Pacearchaeota archaeon]|nr:hypothetical protein [Candidatus Pacearchaeota archaeon]
MVKRIKRLEKGIDSLKKEIEEHFSKLEKDIQEGRIERGRYHAKEIDKSLLQALEIKIEILGAEDDSLKNFRERLNNLKKKFDR